MTMTDVRHLRNQAVSQSLFCGADLIEAFGRLKFVQADPIRSPARAQDLILRQRVADYRAGDLERSYPFLNLEEDILYAYGFMTRDVWELLYPRKEIELSPFEQKIFETVNKRGELHPRELEIEFGRERVVNAWGGYSQASKRALERLHYCGLLRVTRREKGIRVYGVAPSLPSRPILLTERVKKLFLVTANILAPVTEKCLRESLAYLLRRTLPQAVSAKAVIDDLTKSGELLQRSVDGINYLSPSPPPQSSFADLSRDEVPRRVRFLAPFDPLVWDRRRFEHFWGWAYRFEAYTPPAKRVRGYYAMPVLWGDSVIGWANVKAKKEVFDVELGYAGEKPADPLFRLELEKEIGRLENFLDLKAENARTASDNGSNSG